MTSTAQRWSRPWENSLRRPDRLLRLAKAHKEILQEHRLDARDLNTMCQKCGCCDIVPFRDI